MDIIDVLMAMNSKTLKDATAAANQAASDANAAISAIYHDKNFLLVINEDSSLSLTYDPDAE